MSNEKDEIQRDLNQNFSTKQLDQNNNNNCFSCNDNSLENEDDFKKKKLQDLDDFTLKNFHLTLDGIKDTDFLEIIKDYNKYLDYLNKPEFVSGQSLLLILRIGWCLSYLLYRSIQEFPDWARDNYENIDTFIDKLYQFEININSYSEQMLKSLLQNEDTNHLSEQKLLKMISSNPAQSILSLVLLNYNFTICPNDNWLKRFANFANDIIFKLPDFGILKKLKVEDEKEVIHLFHEEIHNINIKIIEAIDSLADFTVKMDKIQTDYPKYLSMLEENTRMIKQYLEQNRTFVKPEIVSILELCILDYEKSSIKDNNEPVIQCLKK